MKHFLSCEADGSISGINPYQEVGTGLRGWPDDYEIGDPNTVHAESRGWRERVKNQPTGGFINYECPCPRTAQNCNCASASRMTKYVDMETRELVDKYATRVLVDGVIVETSGQVVSKPAGSKLTIKVEIPGVPDGEMIVAMHGMPQLLDDPEPMVEMTTADGGLPEFDAYAPAQGLIGQLRIYGRICTLMEVRIRGWGS